MVLPISTHVSDVNPGRENAVQLPVDSCGALKFPSNPIMRMLAGRSNTNWDADGTEESGVIDMVIGLFVTIPFDGAPFRPRREVKSMVLEEDAVGDTNTVSRGSFSITVNVLPDDEES